MTARKITQQIGTEGLQGEPGGQGGFDMLNMPCDFLIVAAF